MEVITQSAIRAFLSCQRKYQFSYVQLYKSARVSEPLFFGTIWHEVREAWWKAPGHDRLNAAMRKLSKLVTEYSQKDDESDRLDAYAEARLLTMLIGYHTRWCNYVNTLAILGVEEQYEIPLYNPYHQNNIPSKEFVIQGKFDAIVRTPDKALWVVEEKTASGDLEIDAPYWRKLEMDPQCSIYFGAVKEIYKETPKGILYFVNIKPSYKPLKKTENIKTKKDGQPKAGQRLEDESPTEYAKRISDNISNNPDRFYKMVEVARLSNDITESAKDVWHTAEAISAAKITGTWLRNPDACIHPFGFPCTFLPVCSNRASILDTSLYRKADTAHEELNG